MFMAEVDNMIQSVVTSLSRKYFEFAYRYDSHSPTISYIGGNIRVDILLVLPLATYCKIWGAWGYDDYCDETKIREASTLFNNLEKTFLKIIEDRNFPAATVNPEWVTTLMPGSKLSALDIEINRSRNKLKYMEAQLFTPGTPSGQSSDH